MRTFVLNRLKDVSGVSGTGVIAEGAMFKNGRVVLQWNTATPSINIYDSIEDVFRIHGHEGATKIEFLS